MAAGEAELTFMMPFLAMMVCQNATIHTFTMSYLLCCDPWQAERHHKSNVCLLACRTDMPASLHVSGGREKKRQDADLPDAKRPFPDD